MQDAVSQGRIKVPGGYKVTFRRLQQAINTALKLIKQGSRVVPAVVWGLLRSYTSTLSQQQQQLCLQQLAASCKHISQADATCFAPAACAASDALPWLHSAKQLEVELSALEKFAIETAASALLRCKDSALEAAGHACTLLLAILEGIFPAQADAVAALKGAAQTARAGASLQQLQQAVEQSSLVGSRSFLQEQKEQTLQSRFKLACKSLQGYVPCCAVLCCAVLRCAFNYQTPSIAGLFCCDPGAVCQ